MRPSLVSTLAAVVAAVWAAVAVLAAVLEDPALEAAVASVAVTVVAPWVVAPRSSSPTYDVIYTQEARQELTNSTASVQCRLAGLEGSLPPGW